MTEGTRPSRGPLRVLEPTKLTTQEQIALIWAGFSIPWPCCNYCHARLSLYDPHWGCDLKFDPACAGLEVAV